MITLDTIKTEDLPILRDWRNSKNVRPYCRQYRYLTDADMADWYDRISSCDSMVMFGIRDLSKISLIGACGITRINWRWRMGEVSFYIGPSGYCTEENIGECLTQLTKFAFNILNLHKLYWPIYEFNPYLKIYEKFMPHEATLKKEYYWDGKYWDRIILTKYA